MRPERTIDRSTYLAALGLFTLAVRHRRKTDEFYNEVGALLGIDPSSHIGDAIFTDRSDFDEALARENIKVSAQEIEAGTGETPTARSRRDAP